MPAVSAKQQRFMGMCHANPNANSKCPPAKVAEEFAHKPASGYAKTKKPADYHAMAKRLLSK